ncbi:MAG: hypothetical protein ABIT16_03650 [Croceibacterium sp.]
MALFRTIALAALLCLAAPAAAQDPAVVYPPMEQRIAAAAQASRAASQMIAYDQAAWHATDQFLADAGSDTQSEIAARFPGAAGFVVIPTETQGQLEVLFVANRAEGPVAVASYIAEGSTILSGAIFAPGSERPLSPLAKRMFDAHNALLAAAAENSAGLCAPGTPNTLVLPPDESGVIHAYLLTPQTDPNSYPLGGHYRATIQPDGTVSEFRALYQDCLPITWDPEASDLPMQSFIATHSLDPQPNEIHGFVSYYVPFPMGIVTGDSIWIVIGGEIGEAVPMDAETGEIP